MVSDGEAQAVASRHGLQLVNVLWEDTGRFQGSSVGPNISDVTIEVASGDGAADARAHAGPAPAQLLGPDRRRAARPRLPARRERAEGRGGAGDLAPRLPRRPGRFLSAPGAGRIQTGSLLAPRDTHALVSAQAAFLPVPKQGKATFHPVIFNYQSTARNPAVLTILVTRQGASLTVDRQRARHGHGRRELGAAALLQRRRRARAAHRGAGERRPRARHHHERRVGGEPRRRREPPDARAGPAAPPRAAPRARPPVRRDGGAVVRAARPRWPSESEAASDLEVAVLGHGELEGPFTELDGLEVERDPRFPVRVTVQFYQATATGQVGEAEMAHLAGLVSKVYEKGDFVGSLVVPAPGDPRRPTRGTAPRARPRTSRGGTSRACSSAGGTTGRGSRGPGSGSDRRPTWARAFTRTVLDADFESSQDGRSRVEVEVEVQVEVHVHVHVHGHVHGQVTSGPGSLPLTEDPVQGLAVDPEQLRGARLVPLASARTCAA